MAHQSKYSEGKDTQKEPSVIIAGSLRNGPVRGQGIVDTQYDSQTQQ